MGRDGTERRATMGMSGECGCGTSLADALGGLALPDTGRTTRAGHDGEGDDVMICFWCGQASVNPELAEAARFRGRPSRVT